MFGIKRLHRTSVHDGRMSSWHEDESGMLFVNI